MTRDIHRVGCNDRIGERVGQGDRGEDHLYRVGVGTGVGVGHTDRHGGGVARPRGQIGKGAGDREIGIGIGEHRSETFGEGTGRSRVGHGQNSRGKVRPHVGSTQTDIGGEAIGGVVVRDTGQGDHRLEIGRIIEGVGQSDRDRVDLERRDVRAGDRVGIADPHRRSVGGSLGDVGHTADPIGIGAEGIGGEKGTEHFGESSRARSRVGDREGDRGEGLAHMGCTETVAIQRDGTGRIGITDSSDRVAVGREHRVGQGIGQRIGGEDQVGRSRIGSCSASCDTERERIRRGSSCQVGESVAGRGHAAGIREGCTKSFREEGVDRGRVGQGDCAGAGGGADMEGSHIDIGRCGSSHRRIVVGDSRNGDRTG